MKQGKKIHWFWRSFLITACLLAMTAGLFTADYNTRRLSDENGDWLTTVYGQQQERWERWQTDTASFWRGILPSWWPEPSAWLPASTQFFLQGEEEGSRLLRSQWEKMIKK